MDTELEDGGARLRHHLEEMAMDMPSVPPDFGAEFAALNAKLSAVEEEKDSLRSTAGKRQATTPSRPDNCRRVAMMSQLIPAELELWMVDRQSELQEALSLGECAKVLESAPTQPISTLPRLDLRGHESRHIHHAHRSVRQHRRQVGEASHPGPRVGELSVHFRRLRPRRSQSRSHGVRGTVVDTESPHSLIQDAKIPSDREDDSLVPSGVVYQNESLEDFEGAHRNVRPRFEESESSQRPQGSNIVDALDDDLTAADSDTDSLAGASQMGTTENNSRAGEPSRRSLLLVNSGFHPGAEKGAGKVFFQKMRLARTICLKKRRIFRGRSQSPSLTSSSCPSVDQWHEDPPDWTWLSWSRSTRSEHWS